MAQCVKYGLLVVAGGRSASAAWLYPSAKEACEVLAHVLVGLGAAKGRWLKVAEGCCMMQGPEGGGWVAVLYRVWLPEVEAAAAPKQARTKGRRVLDEATRPVLQ